MGKDQLGQEGSFLFSPPLSRRGGAPGSLPGGQAPAPGRCAVGLMRAAVFSLSPL
jgi:hypothetical protein